MSIIELKIPDIGGHSGVNVAEVYVKVGDKIQVDDNLVMLETDKATMEVPASHAGVVTEVLIQLGSKVSEGSVILKLQTEDSVKIEMPNLVTPLSTNNETKAATTASSSSLTPVLVPELSGHKDVAVIEVNVKVGDTVAVDETIITLETDKATMEVPSPLAGVVSELKIQVGAKVNQGDVILLLKVAGGVASSITEPATVASPSVAVVNPAAAVNQVVRQELNPPLINTAATNIDESSFGKAFASPSIRKLARELGVNLGSVNGSGVKGRITEQDVKSFIKGVMSGQIALNNVNAANNTTSLGGGLNLLPWPQVDYAKFGTVRVVETPRIKKISGANLARNWVMIPHVTVFESADITDLEEFRKQLNEEYKKAEIKVTPLAFLIKAVVFALQKFPEFNASIETDSVIYKDYYNIGFAADTPNGLMVPVIKDADKKGIVTIAEETSALAKAARDGKLKLTDMQGGTFTVSSLGGIGSTAFTPIINAPEVAILGVSKSLIQPVWNGREFTPRLMLPLSLSFDHRIVDGASGARFAAYLAKLLADLRRLAL